MKHSPQLEEFVAFLERQNDILHKIYPDPETALLLQALVGQYIKSGGKGVTASALSQASHIPRSTVLRRLESLLVNGYVHRDDKGQWLARELAIETLDLHRALHKEAIAPSV